MRLQDLVDRFCINTVFEIIWSAPPPPLEEKNIEPFVI